MTIGAAAALWAGAVRRTDVGGIGDLGLLDALPVPYFLAIALLTVGFAFLMVEEAERRWLAPLYVLALIVFLHGVTPLIYDEPRYSWVYKHIGVVDLIAHSGPAPRDLDIYANWPAFFGLGAWFERVSGVAAIDYAPWAQVFFNAATAAVLVFLYRGLTRNVALIWCAVWIFMLGNWIGQDIFAPQSFAFLALVAFVGVVVRCAPSPRAAANWLERLIARLPAFRAGGNDREEPPALAPLTAVLVGAALFVATVVSHQLTPVVMVLLAVGLMLFARRIALWMVAAMIVVEGIWASLAAGYISGSYDYLNFSPLERLGPQKSLGGEPVAAQQIIAWGARGVILVLVALAVRGAWLRYRAGKRDVELWVLIVAPALVIPLQSYGGEAPLRAFLFALPALAFMVASLLVERQAERAKLVTFARVAVASVVIGTLTLFAYFGLEDTNHIGSDDVAAERWIERCAPNGSVVTYVAPVAPVRLSAGYARLTPQSAPTSPNLIEDGPAGPRRWGPEEVGVVSELARKFKGTANYILLSPAQQRYLDFYGLVKPGSVAALNAGLSQSNDYRLVFKQGGAYIYESRPPTSSTQPAVACARAPG